MLEMHSIENFQFNKYIICSLSMLHHTYEWILRYITLMHIILSKEVETTSQ